MATVDGWSVIVQKSQFKPGDKCVYIEIDSVLPEKPEFEFLRKRDFRIRTLKMAGVISQGICFPLDILPPKKSGAEYEIGEDVTDVIGIKQYEPTMDKEPDELVAKQIKTKWPKFLMRYEWFRTLVKERKPKKGGFPSFIRRTDEDRIQGNLSKLLDKREWVASEKIDGCLFGKTAITTDQGYFTISEIVNHRMPVNVLSYNEELKCCEFKQITDYHKIANSRPHYKIGVAARGHGNRPKFIECTDNHKFLTTDGWKRADELTTQDKLLHYSKIYPSELEDVIVGCILGDSSLNSNCQTGAYRTIGFSHGDSQKDYYEYKKRLIGKLFIDQGTRTSGYGTLVHYGCLASNLQVRDILLKYFNPTGKKFVSQTLAQAISPISLAFWYMDDGTIKNREDDNLQCRAMLCTNRYSYEENVILSEALRTKFNIVSTIGEAETYKGHVLMFDAENTNKLCLLIAPYVCTSMKYKLPKKYQNMPCVFENFSMDYAEGVVQTEIKSIECLGPTKAKFVYDLEVADNHNYFAKNVLVHNCSGTWALLRHKRHWPFKDKFEYIVCSRNLRLTEKDNSSYWKISDKYQIENALRNMIGDREWIAIQGECVGPKIQGNKYKLNDYDMYVFNLIYPTGRMDSITAKSIIENKGMNFVPIINEHYVLPDTMEQALKDATGPSALNPDTLREGFVIRSKDGKESWKIVSPEFLLKYNE